MQNYSAHLTRPLRERWASVVPCLGIVGWYNPSSPTLNTKSQAGWIGYHFYSGLYDLTRHWTSNIAVSVRTIPIVDFRSFSVCAHVSFVGVQCVPVFERMLDLGILNALHAFKNEVYVCWFELIYLSFVRHWSPLQSNPCYRCKTPTLNSLQNLRSLAIPLMSQQSKAMFSYNNLHVHLGDCRVNPNGA